MKYDKKTLIKLWNLSVQNMSPDVSHEVAEDLSINSYSIQLPSFVEEPVLCNIQLFKLSGEKPKLSIIVGSYIEIASVELKEKEFYNLRQNYIDKNEIIELKIRENLIKKAEKNIEMIIKSI